MNNWNDRWLKLTEVFASFSKDRSRKVGSIIVDDRQVMIASGWNGFPRGVDDNIVERHERPLKYKYTEHAERNAIYNAAANGHSTRGCTMYLMWYPCCDCARAIIQSGIINVVCVEPDWNDPTYKDDFYITKEMLDEAGVNVQFINNYIAPERK